MTDDPDFERFVREVEPALHRALLGAVGVDRVDDAVAEAVAYAFEHRDRLAGMSNPVGYLFRVGQSRSRRRKPVRLFSDGSVSIPDVEPGLVEALARLPESQRIAVWLAHGCLWTHAEIGAALGVSPSTVATHVRRALTRLRAGLGVVDAHH